MKIKFILICILFGFIACQDQQKSHIVFIYTDDQATHSKQYLDEVMPNVHQYIIAESEEFTHYICSSPFCSPSRATIISGKYPHNHKHYNNSTSYADFYAKFRNQSLGILMQEAGYYTMFVGKYFNPGFPKAVAADHIPEGWDAFLGMKTGKYLNTPYILQMDSKNLNRTCPPNEPRSKIETIYLEEKLKEYNSLGIDKPLFIYYAPFEPHHPERGSPIESWFPKHYTSKFNHLSLKEDGFSLKQSYQKNRLRSLNHLDDNLKRVFVKLNDFGYYDDSYIFFTSDNGFKLNHHGQSGKRSAFEEDIQVPFYVKHPQSHIKQGENDKLIGTIDMLPTFLDIANHAHSGFDGMSIFSRNHRDYILSEMIHTGQSTEENWWALRSKTDKLVKYESGRIEYFDISTHPEKRMEIDDQKMDEKLAILNKKIACDTNCEM